MSNALRDQLLKQGLVSKKQAKQVEKQAKLQIHQSQKKKKKKQGASEKTIDTESAAYLAAQAREQEISRAKELNRQKEIERQQKELYVQVQDLIQCHYDNDPDANSRYHFVENQWVKSIEVTLKQRRQLAKGLLAITFFEEKYYLVPEAIAEKILNRLPEVVICYYKNVKPQQESTMEENFYVDYPIPDDLIW